MDWYCLYDTAFSYKYGYSILAFCYRLCIASYKAKRILKEIGLVYNNRNASGILEKRNIMEPLLILVVTYIITLVIVFFYRKQLLFLKASRIALSVMFVFTGFSHFVYAEGMAMMLPSFLPFRPMIIYITGIIEMILALGIFSDKKRLTGMLAGIFLIAVLPCNIYAAYLQVNIVTAKYDGEGLFSLLYRVPIQFFFIYCIYWSLIKNDEKHQSQALLTPGN